MKFVKALLPMMMLILTPSNVLSAEVQYFKDWVFAEELDADGTNICVAFTQSNDLQFTYRIWVKSEMQFFKIHWSEGPGLDPIVGKVYLEFNNGFSYQSQAHLEGEGLFLGQLQEDMLTKIKKYSSFGIFQNKKMIAGPFSLKGSTKALSLLEAC